MPKLPPEVVLRFLQICYGRDKKTFLSCMRVNRVWNQLGESLPWIDIRIGDENHERTLQNFVQATAAQRNHVKTITIGLNNMVRFVHVQSCLHRLPNLESISITTSLRNTYDQLSVCTCINSIPSTVKYLSIHNNMRGIQRLTTELSHTCLYLRRLLPQLRKLQLGWPTVCTELMNISTSCPQLKELSFFDVIPPFSDQAHTFAPLSNKHEEMAEHMHDFVQSFKAARDEGVFPELARAKICGRRHEYRASKNSFSCYFKVDLLEETTTIYPTAYHSFKKLSSREKHGMNAFRWIRYRDSSGAVVDLCGPSRGSSGDWVPHLLNDDAWLETKDSEPTGNSIMLPRELQEARDYLIFDHVQLSDLTRRADEIKGDPDVPPLDIWFWERILGRHLLEPKVLQGTVYPDVQVRDEPAEEALLKKLLKECPEYLEQAEAEN